MSFDDRSVIGKITDPEATCASPFKTLIYN